MEKIKYLPKKDRPKDYLVFTCPNCGRQKFSTTPHRGAKLGVCVYKCGFGGASHWDGTIRKIVVVEGCEGLAPYKINSKYM
jgi:transcription elongation factor Elf1